MTDHSHVYSFLERACERPKPFEHGTAKELWTDPHTSESMLRMHLDVQTDAASRNAAFIARSVDWIASRFGVGPGCTVADFGCGPGLYTTALAKKGAQVTGIDFSQRSLRHARETALAEALDIDYVHQDYLRFETDRRFRLITLITCDFCALSPDSRMALLRKFNSLLAPEGRILFDVYSLNALAAAKSPWPSNRISSGASGPRSDISASRAPSSTKRRNSRWTSTPSWNAIASGKSTTGSSISAQSPWRRSWPRLSWLWRRFSAMSPAAPSTKSAWNSPLWRARRRRTQRGCVFLACPTANEASCGRTSASCSRLPSWVTCSWA